MAILDKLKKIFNNIADDMTKKENNKTDKEPKVRILGK